MKNGTVGVLVAGAALAGLVGLAYIGNEQAKEDLPKIVTIDEGQPVPNLRHGDTLNIKRTPPSKDRDVDVAWCDWQGGILDFRVPRYVVCRDVDF